MAPPPPILPMFPSPLHSDTALSPQEMLQQELVLRACL